MMRIPLPKRIDKTWLKTVGRNLGFGAFSRITALGSQFVFLILLGKFLEKSVFGDFMIVFALVRVLSAGIGTGLATLLVYHISRNASPEREASLHRSVAAVGIVGSGALSAAMALLAPQIAGLFDKPTLVPWLVSLSPFLLVSTMLTVSVGALDGRGKITQSIMAVELFPNIIRLICIPLLIPLGLLAKGIAPVMLLSVLLPWLFVAAPVMRHMSAGFARLTAWDMQYAGKLVIHSFAAMQMQGIDMLVVGWLFTSNVAADYAIASRVAALIPFFQQIIVRTFMARAGRAIHEEDVTALQTEINRSRQSSILLVTATAVAAMIAYPLLTHFMGNFGNSMPILAILAAGAIYRSYFPGPDALIRVAGHANFSLGIMLTSLGFLLIIPFLLSQWIGAYAVAFSMLLSGVILNPVMDRFIRRTLHVHVIDRTVLISMALGVGGTIISFFGAHNIYIWIAGCLVTGSSIAVSLRHLTRT